MTNIYLPNYKRESECSFVSQDNRIVLGHYHLPKREEVFEYLSSLRGKDSFGLIKEGFSEEDLEKETLQDLFQGIKVGSKSVMTCGDLKFADLFWEFYEPVENYEGVPFFDFSVRESTSNSNFSI